MIGKPLNDAPSNDIIRALISLTRQSMQDSVTLSEQHQSHVDKLDEKIRSLKEKRDKLIGHNEKLEKAKVDSLTQLMKDAAEI